MNCKAASSVLLLGLVCCSSQAIAQAPATQPAADALVTMDFPADGVELRVLADIVTKRLKIPIIYDDTIINKRVIVHVPRDVPESALLGILQSALRMKQMVLVDAEQPGWKQIVPAQNLAAVAKPAAPGKTPEPGTAVTQIFNLKHADPARAVEAIKPFLSQPGGNIQPVPGQKTLIVSDYSSVIQRVDELLRLLDSEAAVEIQFVRLKEADARDVATMVTQLLASRQTAQPGGASAALITPDERLNQVVVAAPADQMKEILQFISGLDKTVELQTKVYPLKAIGPDRLDRLIKNLFGGAAKRSYQATADRETRSLVVAATPEVHERIAQLLRELDVPTTQEQSPIRFYRLKNTKAVDVLATISGLQTDEGLEGFRTDEQGNESAPSQTRPRATGADRNLAPLPRSDRQMSNPPAAADAALSNPGQPRTRSDLDSIATGQTSDIRYGSRSTIAGADEGAGGQKSAGTVRTHNATVTADVNTNSIIVIAEPAVQQMYQDLIKRLDERRPQVQIECTIVTLDTTSGASFGVDIGKLGGFGTSQLLTFSSFGVSSVDPKTGSLTPTAGRGGTFALLSPRIADVVLRALSENSRSRLISAPQILVNDNGKGKLQSVTQEPFAEILDTATTQSRTGLGGQAQAGTTISVEPHISEDDYLQLSYTVELSSFTGQGQNGLPPPSQKNTVDSTVTIPDGYTIVVGGLSVKNLRTTVQSIPIIGDIPILKYFFSTRTRSNTDTTLFVFIKPVILRDDRFEDLKFISEGKGVEAGLPGNYPTSEPVPMR
jgi:general secretion pathway protein D